MADKKKILEGTLIDENTAFTLKEICAICRVHAEDINEMIEYSIIEPQIFEEELFFTMDQMKKIRKAIRLQHDFHINLSGLALSLDLLETIEELQKRLEKLENQLAIFRSNL